MATIISSRAVHCRTERSHSHSFDTGPSFRSERQRRLRFDRWRIISREFRENLEWAVVVPGEGEISPAVAGLLDELSARGITLDDSRFRAWANKSNTHTP